MTQEWVWKKGKIMSLCIKNSASINKRETRVPEYVAMKNGGKEQESINLNLQVSAC